MNPHARRHAARHQLALDHAPARSSTAPCPICQDQDGWWLDDEDPPVWEPCWAHESLNAEGAA